MLDQLEAEKALNHVVTSDLRGKALRAHAMRMLSLLEGYDWCGIYRLEGDTLVLDEFVGDPTEHTRIPVGQGVCGTAVAQRSNQIVEDVRQVDNYLACSTATRSEIVVLIQTEGEILGQIDVDSHTMGRFTEEDEQFLDKLAVALAENWDE
jgi:L-methionine (R)-S-oxide reductase